MYNNMMGGMAQVAWGPPKFKNLKLDNSKKEVIDKIKGNIILIYYLVNKPESGDDQPTPTIEVNETNQV
jgi:hypothetical protein